MVEKQPKRLENIDQDESLDSDVVYVANSALVTLSKFTSS